MTHLPVLPRRSPVLVPAIVARPRTFSHPPKSIHDWDHGPQMSCSTFSQRDVRILADTATFVKISLGLRERPYRRGYKTASQTPAATPRRSAAGGETRRLQSLCNKAREIALARGPSPEVH